MRDSSGKEIPFGAANVQWGLFTMQDAIDFAQYAVDVTIKSMHYSNLVETVGGPIDILVIKPEKAFWIQHKELHAQSILYIYIILFLYLKKEKRYEFWQFV